MALPKTKVKERLKAKFPGVNLSNARIDALADKLKLEEDAEDDAIDERLDELNDIFSFADMAKTDDRLRSIDADKKKKESTDNPDPKPDPKTDPKPDPDVPAWAQALIDSNKTLHAELTTIKAGKIGETRKDQLSTRLKDVNPKFKDSVLKNFNRMKFETDEEFDTFLTEVEEDAKDFVQSENDEGFKGITPPVQSKGSSKKLASKEEVDELSKNILR